MVRCLAASLAVVFLAACPASSSSPAARSPLREQLASTDTSDVEQAARTCLQKSGWKVDPIGGLSGGANVVTAYKAKEQTDVYIYPPTTNPRITGGPDYTDGFWGCLGHQLGGSGGGVEKTGGDKGGDDKSDKSDKADKAGGDKPPADKAH
jgi:hypothetical protein